MATDEKKITASDVTGAKVKKLEPGFDADGKAYPGVDPDTGERKALTYEGAKQEFGVRVGARLYNQIAVLGFGGVQANRPALSLVTLGEKYSRPRLQEPVTGTWLETEEEYAAVVQKRSERRDKVNQLLAEAYAERAKEA